MNEKTLNRITIFGTVFVGLIFLSWWFLYNPVKDFVESVPGRDNRPEGFTSLEVVELGALYTEFDGTPSQIQGSWPRFRGAGFDNISRENIRLTDK